MHGSIASPVNVLESGQLIVTVESALSIVNVFESLEPVWFASPPYVAEAVAVPAFVLLV